MSRHASEIADIESERDRRLAALERELSLRHSQNVRDLRAEWEDEQQGAWQRERQLLSQRLKLFTYLYQKELKRS
jgi:hypothetical protein